MKKIIPIVFVFCLFQACKITSKPKENKSEDIEHSDKIGGCVFKEVQNINKVNPLNQAIKINSKKSVFSKRMNVLGLDFIAMEKVSDNFLKDVGQTMKEMFPQDSTLNLPKQHKVLNNFGLDVVNSLSAEELANTYTTKLDAYILPLGTEKMAMHQISKRTSQGGQNG